MFFYLFFFLRLIEYIELGNVYKFGRFFLLIFCVLFVLEKNEENLLVFECISYIIF